MRKKLGETGFLAVAIWAAAMSSTAWSCAVDEEFENNGSSPIYAVPLASEPGSSLKLHLSSGGIALSEWMSLCQGGLPFCLTGLKADRTAARGTSGCSAASKAMTKVIPSHWR